MTTILEDSIKSQTDKINRMASDTHFPFVCFATEIDGTHKNDLVDVPKEIFKKISSSVSQENPNATYMLIAAGPKSCSVFVHCGAESKIHGAEWLNASRVDGTEWLSWDDNNYFATIPFQNPMKDKEQISGAAFSYLRKNNLMEEEEEIPPFDLNDY